MTVSTLLRTNLKAWLSAKGFWMVVIAALLPTALTGAWLATHQADVAALGITADRASFEGGDAVNFTAVFQNVGGSPASGMNNTLVVLNYQVGGVFSTAPPGAQNTTRADSLAPGEQARVDLAWTAQPGVFLVLAKADFDNQVGELEEFNNTVQYNPGVRHLEPIVVLPRLPGPDEGPADPGNLTGNASANATLDAGIASLDWSPQAVNTTSTMNFTAVVRNAGPAPLRNASVTLRVGVVTDHRLAPYTAPVTQHVDLEPGATQAVTLTWKPFTAGAYWAEAWVNVTQGDARDAVPADNHVARAFAVHPTVPAELIERLNATLGATDPTLRPYFEPPEKATIKGFETDVVKVVLIPILLPLIALFYAGGVLADERERGTLPYLLTRVDRWTVPVAKFVAGYLVAALAVLLGLLATFALLFGAPGANASYLVTPVLISLLTLFAYGALFVLLGILVDRPYLVGIAFVLGWEVVAGSFVPWVQQLTLHQHLLNAIQGWDPSKGVQWLPAGEEATRALLLVLFAAFAFLGAATYAMKRKEFDV
jgi:ABC-type transport system involved in multi-copper enzyme maturation permease subunit